MQGAVVGLRDRQTARIDLCALCCSNAKRRLRWRQAATMESRNHASEVVSADSCHTYVDHLDAFEVLHLLFVPILTCRLSSSVCEGACDVVVGGIGGVSECVEHRRAQAGCAGPQRVGWHQAESAALCNTAKAACEALHQVDWGHSAAFRQCAAVCALTGAYRSVRWAARCATWLSYSQRCCCCTWDSAATGKHGLRRRTQHQRRVR